LRSRWRQSATHEALFDSGTIERVRPNEFLIRATAALGWRLTSLSSRLAAEGRTLAGERDVEWSWTLAHLHSGPGRVLDFGSGNGMMALGASFAGNQTVAVDLEQEQYLFRGHDIEYVEGDFNQLEFQPQSFDQILNCSSIEHVGLGGRYGSPHDADGDLRAMAKMADLLKPDGNMVLSIPLGVDAVFSPWHRIYGEERLPRLLERWEIRQESYWAKVDGRQYEPVTRGHALVDQGSTTYYALGLYVVTPR
jgi:SAM-dependent methyltransferase